MDHSEALLEIVRLRLTRCRFPADAWNIPQIYKPDFTQAYHKQLWDLRLLYFVLVKLKVLKTQSTDTSEWLDPISI